MYYCKLFYVKRLLCLIKILLVLQEDTGNIGFKYELFTVCCCYLSQILEVDVVSLAGPKERCCCIAAESRLNQRQNEIQNDEK